MPGRTLCTQCSIETASNFLGIIWKWQQTTFLQFEIWWLVWVEDCWKLLISVVWNKDFEANCLSSSFIICKDGQRIIQSSWSHTQDEEEKPYTTLHKTIQKLKRSHVAQNEKAVLNFLYKHCAIKIHVFADQRFVSSLKGEVSPVTLNHLIPLEYFLTTFDFLLASLPLYFRSLSPFSIPPSGGEDPWGKLLEMSFPITSRFSHAVFLVPVLSCHTPWLKPHNKSTENGQYHSET